MKHPRIIGLTGEAGSGKDTAAELLQIHRHAVRAAFADPLYEEVSEAFGIPVQVLAMRSTKETPQDTLALIRSTDISFQESMLRIRPDIILEAPRSPRQILQWWGTEYRRSQTPHYWTGQMMKRLAKLSSTVPPPACIVITDVRKLNEAEMLRTSWHAELWRITRPGCTPPTTGHASEIEARQIQTDLTLCNSHDIRHLQGLVLTQYDERAALHA